MLLSDVLLSDVVMGLRCNVHCWTRDTGDDDVMSCIEGANELLSSVWSVEIAQQGSAFNKN